MSVIEIQRQANREYKWLQVVTFDQTKCLPWVCVDCRTGTEHRFKTSDDARNYAELEGISFYL